MLKPLFDQVLVRRAEHEEKKSLIITPDSAKEKPLRGEIVAVGPGKFLDSGDIRKMSVKVGDRVVFSKYSGVELKEIIGDDVLVIREEAILGIE